MKNPIRVSIIVATKDRYETLFDCVRGLLRNYATAAVEIIVRDNSHQPLHDEFLSAFTGFENVVYVFDPNPVSQSENYERAVSIARGDYVTMIGDDDGISWGLLELSAWMDRFEIDAVFPGFSVYLWPGVRTRLSSASEADGTLIYAGPDGPPQLIDVNEEREKVLRSGCTTLAELPRLYYGLVSKRILDDVRRAAGSYFPGPSPDMANAYALSYFVSKFAVTSLPLFIAGNSRKSNAGLGLRGRHVGEIASLPFLPVDTTQSWNHDIPFFWSGQTIWCQSAYSAARAIGKAEEFRQKNHFARLYAKLLVFQPGFTPRTIKAFKHRHSNSGLTRMSVHAVYTLVLASASWASRATGLMLRLVKSVLVKSTALKHVEQLPNVSAASQAVDRVMQSAKLDGWLSQPLPLGSNASRPIRL